MGREAELCRGMVVMGANVFEKNVLSLAVRGPSREGFRPLDFIYFIHSKMEFFPSTLLIQQQSSQGEGEHSFQLDCSGLVVMKIIVFMFMTT